MMGACFECLVEIDGVDNFRACQVEVRAGMQVRRQLVGSSGEPV
jgi:predicted molibdopterin-dependent oxidoreductase YjgC